MNTPKDNQNNDKSHTGSFTESKSISQSNPTSRAALNLNSSGSVNILAKISKSWSLKIGTLILLALLFGIPTFWIDSMVEERTRYFEQAKSSVERMWGSAQRIGTPVLGVPYDYDCGSLKEPQTCQNVVYVYPDVLDAKLEISTQKRTKGIYEIPLYSSVAELNFQFSPAKFQEIPNFVQANWEDAKVHILLKENSGLLSAPTIEWDNLEPNLSGETQNGGAFVIHQDGNAPFHNGMSFASKQLEYLTHSGTSLRMRLEFNGSRELIMVPLATQNSVTMSSDWGHPEFVGQQLPVTRSVDQTGFHSVWKISSVNHMRPRQFNEKESVKMLEPSPSNTVLHRYNSDPGSSGIGVGFKQFVPVSHYTQLTRAIKYAKLFIILTFLFCFFAEVKSGFQIHFINYLLAGAALLMFFVLLLSFSEHIGFTKAYLVASLAIVIQLSVFFWKVLKKSAAAKWAPLFITGLYGFLFSILQSEDYALLTGSLGLFVILSTVMFISSKMNWSQDIEKV